jgi:hypothetical protein
MAAALFAAVAMAYGAPAHAGRVIVVTQPTGGGIIPKGDPVYTFAFNIGLKAGFSFDPFNTFTLLGVPGVRLADPVHGIDGSAWQTPTTNLPDADAWSVNPGVNTVHNTVWPGVDHELVDTSDVAFTLKGPDSIDNTAGSHVLDLGLFAVLTYDSFSTIPLGTNLVLEYVLTARDGTVIDTGDVTLTRGPAVPEPASLALLALGASLPVAVARRRSRRRSAS